MENLDPLLLPFHRTEAEVNGIPVLYRYISVIPSQASQNLINPDTMGKHYDGKRRWNETVLQTSAVGAASKRKRFSGTLCVAFMIDYAAEALPFSLLSLLW